MKRVIRFIICNLFTIWLCWGIKEERTLFEAVQIWAYVELAYCFVVRPLFIKYKLRGKIKAFLSRKES